MLEQNQQDDDLKRHDCGDEDQRKQLYDDVAHMASDSMRSISSISHPGNPKDDTAWRLLHLAHPRPRAELDIDSMTIDSPVCSRELHFMPGERQIRAGGEPG
jgi:hypothetical protein